MFSASPVITDLTGSQQDFFYSHRGEPVRERDGNDGTVLSENARILVSLTSVQGKAGAHVRGKAPGQTERTRFANRPKVRPQARQVVDPENL